MSNNHFNFFRVKNFKRFKDLEVKDIGQFNLVLGDNNVGKTSLLEALMQEENEYHSLDKLGKAFHYNHLNQFNIGEVFDFFLNQGANERFIYFISDNNDGRFHELRIGKSQVDIELFSSLRDDIVTEPLHHNIGELPQITANVLYPFNIDYYKLSELYSQLVQKERKKRGKLVEALKVVIESITALESSISNKEPTFLIETSDSDYLIPIHAYGEGVQKTFEIILYLELFAKDKLMIDEIDAGIHYSRMKDFWKVILQSAIENEVQLFATTHNRECIQYYMEALEELGDEYKEKARSIRLVEHAQTKEIISFTSLISEMKEDFAVGNEVR